jgi:hypothetical protein
MKQLALSLDGSGETLVRVRRKYPTGALATLDVSAPWSELRPGGARLTGLSRRSSRPRAERRFPSPRRWHAARAYAATPDCSSGRTSLRGLSRKTRLPRPIASR